METHKRLHFLSSAVANGAKYIISGVQSKKRVQYAPKKIIFGRYPASSYAYPCAFLASTMYWRTVLNKNHPATAATTPNTNH
jgi:hypothetical protein